MDERTRLDELLPCPFCGGSPVHNGGGCSTYGRLWWAVGCQECDVWISDREVWSTTEPGMLDRAHPPKECFAAWNRRALFAERSADGERLREAASKALAFFEENAEHVSYGYALPHDPRDFHPDPECCTEDERAAHHAACQAWNDAGGEPEDWNKPSTGGWNDEHTAHILLAPWGIGTSTFTDPELAKLRDTLREAIDAARTEQKGAEKS